MNRSGPSTAGTFGKLSDFLEPKFPLCFVACEETCFNHVPDLLAHSDGGTRLELKL